MYKNAMYLLIFVPCICNALGWGYFHGHNSTNERITLEVIDQISNDNSSNEYDEKLIVRITAKSKGNNREYSEVCHRKAYKEIIWCDGNKDSPLFGTTYKFDHEIPGTDSDETPNSETWKCIAGCNQRSPKVFRYDN